MSIAKKSASALGKLLTVVALAAAFAAGLVGVVYMSLRGDEMKVPEIVGKDLKASEAELAALGLKVKSRAARFSNEKPNTILEQLPKAGETVKTGQMILVVTSKTNPDGTDEAPATIKKSGTDEDDTEKIEELISDKPKKATNKANSNGGANPAKKKTSTTRDVLSGNSNSSNTNSADSSANSNKTDANSNSSKDNKNGASNTNKTTNPPADAKKPNDGGAKPAASKTPAKPAATTTSGDVRPRKTP